MKICRVLIAVIISMLFCVEVMACSCSVPVDDIEVADKKAFDNASSVVLARVENVQKVGNSTQEDEFTLEREITHFSHIQSWKGTHKKNFHTNIITQCCLCGVKFQSGEVYLLYLQDEEGDNIFSTSSCSRTTLYENAAEDIEVLDKIAAGMLIEFGGLEPNF